MPVSTPVELSDGTLRMRLSPDPVVQSVEDRLKHESAELSRALTAFNEAHNLLTICEKEVANAAEEEERILNSVFASASEINAKCMLHAHAKNLRGAKERTLDKLGAELEAVTHRFFGGYSSYHIQAMESERARLFQNIRVAAEWPDGTNNPAAAMALYGAVRFSPSLTTITDLAAPAIIPTRATAGQFARGLLDRYRSLVDLMVLV